MNDGSRLEPIEPPTSELAAKLSEVRQELEQRTLELENEKCAREQLQRLVAQKEQQLQRLHEAEEALRESEERFRLLVGHIGDAVFMLDVNARVMTWTPAAQRTLGYTLEEALTLQLADFYPEDERAEGAERELTASRLNGRSEEHGWRVAKGGRLLWAHVVTCPVYGPRQDLRGFTQIVQDRTALREAQHRLALQATELQRSNTELESFAAVAAHDLQEPLRKLRTFGDRLKRRAAPELDPSSLAIVDRMDAAAERMQTLIDGLLRYARVARRPRQLKRVSLNQVLGEVLEELSSAFEQQQAQVEVSPLPALAVDSAQIRQVFQNLLSNSLKFAREGTPPRIKIESRETDDGAYAISFQDNGIGFEPKYAERIFGLLQRLHGRSEYEGTGIGLAICRRVVEQQGGSIQAQGRPGTGSTFTIRLPVMDPVKGDG